MADERTAADAAEHAAPEETLERNGDVQISSEVASIDANNFDDDDDDLGNEILNSSADNDHPTNSPDAPSHEHDGNHHHHDGNQHDGEKPTSRAHQSETSSKDEIMTEDSSSATLYVSGFSQAVKESDLEELFSKHGKISRVQIMCDPHTKESRGFAFVVMSEVAEADACITALHGAQLCERTISVEKARRHRPRSPTPGRYHGPSRRPPSERFGDRRYDRTPYSDYPRGGYDRGFRDGQPGRYSAYPQAAGGGYHRGGRDHQPYRQYDYPAGNYNRSYQRDYHHRPYDAAPMGYAARGAAGLHHQHAMAPQPYHPGSSSALPPSSSLYYNHPPPSRYPDYGAASRPAPANYPLDSRSAYPHHHHTAHPYPAAPVGGAILPAAPSSSSYYYPAPHAAAPPHPSAAASMPPSDHDRRYVPVPRGRSPPRY